jgi:hypothetical protein
MDAVTAIALMGFGMAAPNASAALRVGRSVVYPSAGGTWEYGFWDAKVRSYYRVNRCHGTTVRFNSAEHRSIDTGANQTAIAELWAVNSPWSNDAYFYRTC